MLCVMEHDGAGQCSATSRAACDELQCPFPGATSCTSCLPWQGGYLAQEEHGSRHALLFVGIYEVEW